MPQASLSSTSRDFLSQIFCGPAGLLLTAGLMAVLPASGGVVPDEENAELASLATSDPRLYTGPDHRQLDLANPEFKSAVVDSWSTFVTRQAERGTWNAVVDWRSGLVEVAQGAGVPFVPGYGNELTVADLEDHLQGRSKVDLAALESIARSHLPQLAPLLGTEGRELRLNLAASGLYSDYFWNVEFDVHSRAGQKIEGSRVFFRINNGNLVQFGATRLPAPGTEAPAIQIGRDQALNVFESYLGGFDSARDRLPQRADLKLLPIPVGMPGSFEMGSGYRLLPVWELLFHRQGNRAVWRVRVDGVSGKIVEFSETSSYLQDTGGSWPVSNSGRGRGMELIDQSLTTVENSAGALCDGTYRGGCSIDSAIDRVNNRVGRCEKLMSSSAIYDFAAYDLQIGCSGRNASFPDYSCPGAGGPYFSNGAWNVADRLWYLSRSMANQAFTCDSSGATMSGNGCDAGSDWTVLRAIDDDDGNLANGTPHACQLAAAFNRYSIGNSADSACVGDNITCYRGCPQPAAPTLESPVTGDNQVALTWSPDASPDLIDVFRSEVGCAAGFTKIANDVVGASFVDTHVASGSAYYYQIVRHPVGNESCGSAPSECQSATTKAGSSAISFDDSSVTPTTPFVPRSLVTSESMDSSAASATSIGDCTVAPTFAGVTSVTEISSGGSCGLRIEWSEGSNNCGTEPVVYSVYRSTSAGFIPGPGNLLQTCVTNTFLDDTAIVSDTTYYYKVRAEDDTVVGSGACRNGNVDSNSVEQSGVITSPSVTLFDQTAGQTSNASTSQSFGDFPAFSSERAADFLVPAGGWTVNRVVVNGVYSAGGGPAPSVDVRFYADSGGAIPLSVPQDTAIPACTYSGLLPTTDFTDTAGVFDINLPAPCALPAGRYWLSFKVNMNFGLFGQWFWSHVSSAGVTNENAWRNRGNGFGLSCTAWSSGHTDCGSIEPDMSFQVWGPDFICSVAPGAVKILTATAGGTAVSGENRVEWLNPSSGGYGSTMVRWSTTDYPSDPTAGTLLVDQNDGLGNRGTAAHSGLTLDTTYYYSVFVDNGSGEYSARRTVSARPFDATGNIGWAYSTGASALAPPGIGSVYSVANDRVLHSMDLVSGTWPTGWAPQAMNGPAQGRPPIAPVTVGSATKVAFIGSQDGRVYAFDANTGQPVWTSPNLGAMVHAGPAGIFTLYGGIADLILTGTRGGAVDNAFHALNLADGTIAWSFTNSTAQGGDDTGIGIISGTAAVDYPGSRIYFTSRTRAGGSQNTVWCLSFTGTAPTLLWTRALGDIDAAPILLGNKVYVGTVSGQVHALDSLTGASLWAAPFDGADGAIKGSIWPRFNTAEILFSTTNRLYSVTDNGGSAAQKWVVTTIPNPSPPLAIALAGSSYAWVGSSDGRLYQLDISGAGVPSITSTVLGDGSATVGTPALDIFNDTAFVGTEEGGLYSVALPLP